MINCLTRSKNKVLRLCKQLSCNRRGVDCWKVMIRMPETDVEKTLRDIRERVRVQLRQQAPSSIAHPAESGELRVNGAAIESIRANLSVIERSRTRLPPITSYRRGWAARVELWIKRLLKRASHWFTWEQVNFNSATSNSLKDVLVVELRAEQRLWQKATWQLLVSSRWKSIQRLTVWRRDLKSCEQSRRSLETWANLTLKFQFEIQPWFTRCESSLRPA